MDLYLSCCSETFENSFSHVNFANNSANWIPSIINLCAFYPHRNHGNTTTQLCLGTNMLNSLYVSD